MGIAKHTPLNYGVSMTLVAVTVLFIDIIMKEKIGFGTVIDALLTGNFVQMFNNINPFPENNNLWLGIAVMLVGFVFMAIGMGGYIDEEKRGYMWAETDIYEVDLQKKSMNEVLEYISEIRRKYADYDLYPEFYIG